MNFFAGFMSGTACIVLFFIYFVINFRIRNVVDYCIAVECMSSFVKRIEIQDRQQTF